METISRKNLVQELIFVRYRGEASKKTKSWFINRLKKFTSGDVDQEAFNRAINQNVSHHGEKWMNDLIKEQVKIAGSGIFCWFW